MAWNTRKSAASELELAPHHQLKRTLGWPHLIALGVGAIVGTGILTLIGVGAAKAGPVGDPLLRHRRPDLRRARRSLMPRWRR